MKFTLSWLKDYLDTTASLDEICEGLVGVGLEVEEVSDMTAALAPFKVGYVQHADKHPNADKLRLCKVETDTGIIRSSAVRPMRGPASRASSRCPAPMFPARRSRWRRA
jgi:phenylalanyl-tRNA synthetase beta chain